MQLCRKFSHNYELVSETQWTPENYIHLNVSILKETCLLYNLPYNNLKKYFQFSLSLTSGEKTVLDTILQAVWYKVIPFSRTFNLRLLKRISIKFGTGSPLKAILILG